MLDALFAKDFSAYFADAGAGQSLWLFAHVPKTAGSSIQAEGSEILQPSANIDIDHNDVSRSYQARFDDAVARFIADHKAAPFRFATGHIHARHLELIRSQIPQVRCFTMLRQPIARLISDYRYQTSSMNTARDDFIARTPSFEAYVERPYVHNKMAAHLVPRPLLERGDAQECVVYILRNYAFVGLQDMYPLALRSLTRLFGQEKRPSAKLRVNTETTETGLTPALEAELRRLNALDIAIFQAFLGRYRAIREDLLGYLEASKARGFAP